MGLPLEGVRIIALEQFGAGPFGTMVLADLGAEVIKIEDPATGGDVARTVPPYTLPEGDSLYYQSFNRNKKSVGLNIKDPEGRAIFHDLVRVSDAVYNNLRGDLPAKLGLTYQALKGINPRIVCCSLSGFGPGGPRAAEPGYDYLMQGYSGIMSLTGEPDAPPAKCGISIVDYAGGYVSVLALMVGLHEAQRTRVGRDVDVALLDVAVAMLTYLAAWHLNAGYQATKLADSAHPSLVPTQSFRTGDGWVIVMCFKEKFWENLCEVLEVPHLATDPRFKTFADRLAHREELLALLKPIFLRWTTAEWLDRLRGRVPCAPVNDLSQALRDEQVIHRGMILEVPHPHWGTVRGVACPIKVPGEEMPRHPGPRLGEHTPAILGDLLGVSAERLAALRARNMIV